MIDFQSTHFLIHWLISGFAVLLTAKIVPGFEIKGFITACFAALIIGLANAVFWPFFMFIGLPLTLLTFGLFIFVINGAILKISAAIMPGFELKSWFSAIFGSIVLSIVSFVLHYFLI